MNFSIFGFGSAPKFEILLEDEGRRKCFNIRGTDDEIISQAPLYNSADDIKGRVVMDLDNSSSLDHYGITLEFTGTIDIGDGSEETFLAENRNLEPEGSLKENKSWGFEFSNKNDKVFETYVGLKCRVKYTLILRIAHTLSSTTKEREVAIIRALPAPIINTSIKMEIGIEDLLDLEFEFDQGKFHLRDCLVGKVYFLLVKIPIKHMELSIIQKEILLGVGRTQQQETATLCKYEIMDGCPSADDCIPIRMLMAPYDLTPSYKNVNNKFAVRHYLNLVLIDENEKRYFKQQEIILWRKKGA